MSLLLDIESLVDLIGRLCDSDESRAMKIRATEYKQRSRSLERTGRADLSRVKPTDIPGDELAYSDEESDIQEQQILLLIDDTPRSIGWDTIGGHTELKKELKFHYGLAMAKFPKGVVVEGWQNIMFYGPPGTGKTL